MEKFNRYYKKCENDFRKKDNIAVIGVFILLPLALWVEHLLVTVR